MRLLAFDLDGTLLEPGERILPEAMAALETAAEHGVILGTASGRSIRDQIRILSSNGLGADVGYPHYLIVDECRIYLLEGGSYVEMEEYNQKVRVAWLEVFEQALELVKREVSRLTAEGVRIERVMSEREALERCIISIFFENPIEAEREERLLNSFFSTVNLLHCTRNYRILTVMRSGFDKGSALNEVVQYFKVPPSEVVAVGDSTNDLTMFDERYGFYAATVQNAEDIVKRIVAARGGYIASKPRGAGVAELIHALLH